MHWLKAIVHCKSLGMSHPLKAFSDFAILNAGPFTFQCMGDVKIIKFCYRFAGMYASLPYALAQGDVEIPYLMLQSLLYSVITYWLIRQAYRFHPPANSALQNLQNSQ